ncbi:MAG: VanZ family protein [Burkholderiaceae bacterium]
MSASPSSDKTAISRASPLARAAFAVYALLLIYSGLAPWSGWRDLGLNPFSYLAAPIPAHVTNFDLAVNVLAYIPFGALLAIALHPVARGWTVVLVALLASLILAGSIEAAQSYLPSRISSNLDLLTNSAGALLGALIAAPLSSALVDRGRLVDLRRRWFSPTASRLLLVVALWPVAQIYPQPMLFGNGELRDQLATFAAALIRALPATSAGMLRVTELGDQFEVAEFVLAEAFVVAAALLAAGLAFASTMEPRAPRTKLLLALLAAGLLTKTVASGLHFGPDRALTWLTPGAIGGLALGVLSLLAASAGPRAWSARIALLALAALVIAVNWVPDNPYYIDAISDWRQGELLNFNALARWLSLLWPYALGVSLLGTWLPDGASRPAAPPSL